MQLENKDLLKIGSTTNIGYRSRDEILANFMLKYPEIRLETEKTDFAALLHMLYSGSVSGLFLFAQSGSKNMTLLESVMDDPKLEAFHIDTEHEMYLAISENDPLAQCDEAPFSAFRDFALPFHPDNDVIANAGVAEPFRRLSDASGFTLRTIALDPRDPTTFYLATKMKLAIPVHALSFLYHGIKLVKVSDWTCYSTSFFLTLNANGGHPLRCLMKCIQEYAERNA